MSDTAAFDQQVIDTVRAVLQRLMAEKDSPGDAILTPRNFNEPVLNMNRIYWACIKLHERAWLDRRPIWEEVGIRVTWNPSRHIWYD